MDSSHQTAQNIPILDPGPLLPQLFGEFEFIDVEENYICQSCSYNLYFKKESETINYKKFMGSFDTIDEALEWASDHKKSKYNTIEITLDDPAGETILFEEYI